MVTGSFVSSVWGEPRSTHDIDLVVALRCEHVPQLVAAFPAPHYYVDASSALDAIRSGQMFNLIDNQEGDKVDFWLLTTEPFDQSRFARRCLKHFAGREFPIATAEDTIVAKLRWAEMSGGSEKQFNDALRVYETQSGKLDIDYVSDWITRLKLIPWWERLKAEAKPST